MNFGQKVVKFNESLDFSGNLPAGVKVMNPFRDNICAIKGSTAFYLEYYADTNQRGIILGINPGRFGAAITGVPFTDPKRLAEYCHITPPECPAAREPSSEFVYEVIEAYGGVKKFYADWYINSICPLGFIHENRKGRWVNYNYYDTAALRECALPFIEKTLPGQIALGICTGFCICLGTGKNFSFLRQLNESGKYFGEIIPLEHPRYIVQYRSRERSKYVDKYLETFARCLGRN